MDKTSTFYFQIALGVKRYPTYVRSAKCKKQRWSTETMERVLSMSHCLSKDLPPKSPISRFKHCVATTDDPQVLSALEFRHPWSVRSSASWTTIRADHVSVELSMGASETYQCRYSHPFDVHSHQHLLWVPRRPPQSSVQSINPVVTKHATLNLSSNNNSSIGDHDTFASSEQICQQSCDL